MIKAIIFDKDGVLVDTEEHAKNIYINIFKDMDVDLSCFVFEKCIGRTNFDTYEILKSDLKFDLSYEDFKEIKTKYRNSYYEHIKLDYIDGVIDLLYKLKPKYKLAVASSSSMDSIKHTLAIGNIDGVFDVLHSGEECVKGKPHPEIYLKTADSLGVKPSECIVIEDSTNGIRSAKSAGMTVVAINHNKYQLDQQDADYICDSYEAIFEVINNIQIKVKLMES